MVESKFDENGRPPHHQPEASQKKVDWKSSKTSSIFVVTWDDFNQMTVSDIQAIFRHRHILVTHVPVTRSVKFDADGLSVLADVDLQPVQIQCTAPFPVRYQAEKWH